MKRFPMAFVLSLLVILLAGLPARAAEIASFAGFPFGLTEAQSEATAKKLGLGFKEPWGLDQDTNLHVYSGNVVGATALACVMLAISFVLLLAVNGLQWWAANRHHGRERVSL